MDAAAGQTLQLPGQATTAMLITIQARKLLDLDREIKDLDKLITARFRTHAQVEIIERLPGMGPIIGAEFLGATAGDLAAFANPGRLAAYAGLAPVPADSGRRTGIMHLPPRPTPRVLHGGPGQPPYHRPIPPLLRIWHLYHRST